MKLNSKPILSLLESFKKHEDLMLYSSTKYRDHFMHQFHVFVAGYIIIHYLDIKSVTKLLNKKFAEPRQRSLSVKNTLRTWFLTAIFHDFCYLLPEFDEKIGTFLTEILQDSDNQSKSDNEKFNFKVALEWGQLANKEVGFLKKVS